MTIYKKLREHMIENGLPEDKVNSVSDKELFEMLQVATKRAYEKVIKK